MRSGKFWNSSGVNNGTAPTRISVPAVLAEEKPGVIRCGFPNLRAVYSGAAEEAFAFLPVDLVAVSGLVAASEHGDHQS